MARRLPKSQKTADPPPAGEHRFGKMGVLLVILLAAATLRLAALGHAPPGLNQDEAANAWNAWCLLKTGQDQTGKSWPIFHSRCLGENRSTLFLYLLLPFQALGGLSIWTTRAASAMGGIATVLLTYYVGARLFGRTAGLVAAALLALNPWHIQQSRWGHEAALCPFLVLVPLALAIRANLPLGDNTTGKPSWIWALLAGLSGGIACYGYPAVRLFLPAFFLLAIAVNAPRWWQCCKSRQGAAAVGALLVGLSATFGPLAWKHLTDPEIGKRGKMTAVWKPEDSTATRISKVLARYPGHFGPDFLFINGDTYEIQSPPGFGQFHWYMAPLMIVGLILTISKARSSGSARLLLVWLLTYPLGDLTSEHFNNSMHALRSSPGLCGLILLGTVGAVGAGAWLWRRSHGGAIAIAGMAAIVVLVLNVRFLYYFFGEYNDRPFIYHGYHVDLLKACDWLKPRLNEIDAVFVTTRAMNMPYIVSLVGLQYDPHKWFNEPREFQTTPSGWDVYTRYGKMHFMYGATAGTALRELLNNNRPDRVVFVIRPGDLKIERPTLIINGPPGTGPLWICEQTL